MQNTIRIMAGAAVLLALVASSTPAGFAQAQATRTDNQGGVTVKATYLTPAALKAGDRLAGKVDPQRTIVIAVVLDTHAGDLSTYDFLKNVTLRNDRGQQVAPVRWVSTADGTHHRSGGLLFPKADQTGRAIEPQARALELVVRGLGGITERVLRWSLPIE